MQYYSTSGSKPTWDEKLPNVKETVNEYHLHEFFRIMFERQEIWRKRFLKKEPSPWTKDKILRDYKFTNVYRELDRHSQWEIENIIKQDNLTREDLIWQIMLFRLLNRPETFEFFANHTSWENGLPKYKEFNKNTMYAMIRKFRGTGQNPFTNAYLVNSLVCPGKTRDWCYALRILPEIHQSISEISKVLLVSKEPQEVIDYLIKLPSIANFIAHEMYISFCYVPKYSDRRLMKWNENSWTNVGPGASLGIRLIFPSLNSKNQIKGIYMLKEMASDKLSQFGKFWYPYWSKDDEFYFVSGLPNITLHQIEMWLCEYSKYWKMSVGVGKQRSKFIVQTKV